MLIGYMRVSTAGQNDDGQHDALTAAGVKPENIYSDHGVSGAKASRPALDKMLGVLRDGDTLVVTKLDRLGRSLIDLITLVKALNERGVKFHPLDNPELDTTKATGQMLLGILGVLAEYERALIRERTNVGLTAARARGRVGGRPKLDADDSAVKRAKELKASGVMTAPEIAKTLGVSKATVYRYLSA